MYKGGFKVESMKELRAEILVICGVVDVLKVKSTRTNTNYFPSEVYPKLRVVGAVLAVLRLIRPFWMQKTDIRPAGIESITPNDGWQEIFCRRLHTAMSEAADYH